MKTIQDQFPTDKDPENFELQDSLNAIQIKFDEGQISAEDRDRRMALAREAFAKTDELNDRKIYKEKGLQLMVSNLSDRNFKDYLYHWYNTDIIDIWEFALIRTLQNQTDREEIEKRKAEK